METEVRTFVLTDLVGSTELWDIDPEAMSHALEEHDDLVERIVLDGGGELLRTKGEGDSTFSTFTDPACAVRAAVRIASAVESAVWSTLQPLSVRVGVHVGPAQRRGSNWFGSTVNRTARIRGLAPGGAVFVSGTLAAAIRGADLGVAQLELLGSRRLRGFRERDEIWAVVEEGVALPPLEPDRNDSNVVVPDHDLLGRDEDVRRVDKLVELHRLVTLTGAGGSGKTRLAVEFGLRARSSFVDGVWMVDLSSVKADGVWPLVLSTTGAGVIPSVASVSALADRDCLLVLDNCEHVVDAAAEVCMSLLRSGSRVRILATSRRPLGLSAEATFPTQPLPVPPPGSSRADLDSFSAVQLFVERARLLDPGFVLDAGDAEAMVRCIVALEGVPLAIEIAASQTRTMSLRRLADALERDSPSLRTSLRDVPDRHRSVGNTIEWSFELLDDAHRAVIECLSVARGFDIDTVAAVSESTEVDGALSALVDASLAVSVGRDRFRLLEPVRQYAANRLLQRGDADRCAEALSAHVIRRAGELVGRMFTDPLARQRLHDEAGNVEQSLTWLLDNGRMREATRIVGLLGTYWFSHDQPTGVRWTSRLEPQLDSIDAGNAAPVRLTIGMLRQGVDDESAIVHLSRALEAFTARARMRRAASAAFFLGREVVLAGRPDAEAAVTRALELARTAEEPLLISWSLTWLGLLADEAHDAKLAAGYFSEAVDVSAAAGLGDTMAEALAGQARLALADNDFAGARQLVDRAVSAARRAADNFQLANQLKHRAEACVQIGDLTQAALDVAESGVLALDVGDENQVIDTLAVVVTVLDALGDRTAAQSAVRGLGRWLTAVHPGRHWVVGRIHDLAGSAATDGAPAEPLVARSCLRDALVHLHGDRP